MDNERLRITLDNAEKTYFAGQTVQGKIWFNLVKRTKIRAIRVQITGKGKCKWMEIMRKNSNNESTRSLFYSSKEIYAHCENNLPAFEPRGIELNIGEHTFDFSMPLEWNLPSSFKGSHGSIKYRLRVLIQRPWAFDERHIIPITVIKHMPLQACYRINPTSLEKQITKTISLFGTRPITMIALLPEDFAVIGEPMRVCVTVTNNSTTNVEKLRFTVFQNIWYYSHVPLRIQKTECVSILSKETGAVHKKSERSFAHVLVIPITAQPSDDQFSGVINIFYELRVEAVLRGFFKNLVLNMPFKLYSNEESNNIVMVPPQAQQQQPQSTPALPPPTYIGEDTNAIVANNGGNPFEHNRASLPVYPILETSVGSPTHSSHFSESSSLHSTTSESSDATLSPAVGVSCLSYASSLSSQFNSPTARYSLRGSNVPYMAYSSSPRMFNSYPPPHLPPFSLPDSPQYSPQYSPLPTPTFLRGREPPEAHELPPSYEELFGVATAPPESPK